MSLADIKPLKDGDLVKYSPQKIGENTTNYNLDVGHTYTVATFTFSTKYITLYGKKDRKYGAEHFRKVSK